ncbi:MAG TPA: metal ABC transporter permease [Desulfonatronum sp.]|nr:metal ABC transporter permease [Desulfonatronum sp.]
MTELLQYEFMRNALWACLLISINCGIIGTLVVVNRLVFLSGGIAHASYGGVGVALFCGLPPQLGAAGCAIAASMAMGMISLHAKHRSDTIIGVVWATGMAAGIVLVDLTPGYHVDLMSYLFGSILMVPGYMLWLMAGLDVFVVAWAFLFYRQIQAMSYDEEHAQVMGVPVQGLYFALLGLTALSVVMVIQAVGLILVIALLTVPAVIAEDFSRSLRAMMCWAVLLSMVFTMVGLVVSYFFDLTAGATIVLVAAAVFFIFRIILGMYKGWRARQ